MVPPLPVTRSSDAKGPSIQLTQQVSICVSFTIFLVLETEGCLVLNLNKIFVFH